MFKKNHFKIKRNDYYRVLTTEVLPYETPLIFNNFGLYNFVKFDFKSPTAIELQKRLINGLKKSNTHTIPLSYKIKKNSHEFRKLKLIHPLSQIQVVKFYEKYENLILHYCEASPITIRSPNRIATSFYKKKLLEDINKYRSNQILTSKTEEISKHSPSFFSYRGFNRLYKFFESRKFFNIEEKYSEFCSVDISKCFDSIYTHSISWAVKNKEFTKENVTIKTTFPNEFDSLMQRMNHNETNGIVIGPELSRIFAEIILQKVDIQVIEKLEEKYKLVYGNQYTIKRYVDDFFIFSINKDIQNKIVICLSDVLLNFNLHLNKSKTEYLSRPFITRKSKLVYSIRNIVNDFFDSFLEYENPKTLKPKRVINTWKLTRSFIQSIQYQCNTNGISYDDISAYIISSINERIKKLTNNKNLEGNTKNFLDALEVLIDIQFFLFSISPSTNSSYKISTSLILAIRFVKDKINDRYEHISKFIYDHIYRYLKNMEDENPHIVDDYFPIEAINIILASTELSHEFMLPEDLTFQFFNITNGDHLNYLHVISALYYSGKYSALQQRKKDILCAIEKYLSDLSDFSTNTNKAYLFFDSLFHPDFKKTVKTSWLKQVLASLDKDNPAHPLTQKSIIDQFYNEISSHIWHVDWHHLDLLSYLQKKDLRQAY